MLCELCSERISVSEESLNGVISEGSKIHTLCLQECLTEGRLTPKQIFTYECHNAVKGGSYYIRQASVRRKGCVFCGFSFVSLPENMGHFPCDVFKIANNGDSYDFAHYECICEQIKSGTLGYVEMKSIASVNAKDSVRDFYKSAHYGDDNLCVFCKKSTENKFFTLSGDPAHELCLRKHVREASFGVAELEALSDINRIKFAMGFEYSKDKVGDLLEMGIQLFKLS